MSTVALRDDTPLAAGPRLVLVLFALACAASTIARGRAEERDAASLSALARRAGLAPAAARELDRRLERETSGGARRLLVARHLLDLGLGRRGGAFSDADAGTGDPLATARELAREAVGRQPASWEAPMVAGAAVALERMRDRDARYFSSWRDWQEPLALAAERHPASALPERYLAAAYLETWPALSAAKRPEVALLLRRTFEDERFFSLLYPRWLELAGSLDAAAELLPDRPETWRRLAASALRRWELGPALRFRARARESESQQLEARIDFAVAALERTGDLRRAKSELAAVVAALPLERSSTGRLERALAVLPAGPGGRALAETARRWLEWALPLCALRNCPLAPAAFARLGSLAGAELPSELDAAAAVAAGDLARADRLALRAQALWSESWAPFVVLAAKARLEAGERAEAAARLAPLHREARKSLAARRVARAAGAAGFDGPPPEAARWEANEWRGAGAARALELLPARPFAALVVELHRPTPGRALLIAEWDGEPLPPVALAAGDRQLRIAPPRDSAASAEPHLLRLSLLAGELPEVGATILE
jgi:hypothetical protein